MKDGSPSHRYYDVTFDADFLTAARDDGRQLRFSRLERTLLTSLARRPGRLFSREQLLAAMRSEPDELNDRNVDFVINRLRRKLDDPARAPRFIATQYGEGYVWIAPLRQVAARGFLVIGPLRGLTGAADGPILHHMLDRLHEQIAGRCAVGQEIVLLPNWSREPGAFRFSVSVDLIFDGGRLQAAFALRDEDRGRVVRVVRCALEPEVIAERMREAASRLVAAIWRDLVLFPGAQHEPAGPPLEIRMQDAAATLSRSIDRGWAYIAERLAEEQAEAPDDPELAVMRATYLYARMMGGIDFDGQPESYRRLEAEMERLLLGALPEVRADPILRLAVAKLLFMVGGRHLAVVEELIRESLAESSMFAAVLSHQGTLHAFRGDLAAAVGAFDQALALCQPGTEFQIYLLVKKSTLPLADGDWPGCCAIFRQIVEHKPAAERQLQLFYLPGDDRLLEPAMAKAVERATRGLAAWVMSHQLFMIARHFSEPRHARNIMAGPARHLLPRFGDSILPAEAPSGMAWLLDELRAMAAPGERCAG